MSLFRHYILETSAKTVQISLIQIGCEKMSESKPLLLSSKKFIKVATQLKDSGYYTVNNNDSVIISTDKTRLESFCVILSDSLNMRKSFDISCEHEVIVLTDTSDKQRYITENNGMLFLSKHLETENICETIKFILNNQSIRTKVPKRVSQMLLYLGIEAHLKGYTYLRTIISMIAENSELNSKPVMHLYKLIARHYGVNERNVERAIRNAIESAYDKNSERFHEIFNYAYKPRNYEFIASMAEYIRFSLI